VIAVTCPHTDTVNGGDIVGVPNRHGAQPHMRFNRAKVGVTVLSSRWHYLNFVAGGMGSIGGIGVVPVVLVAGALFCSRAILTTSTGVLPLIAE
jgi:hypothetical protein